MHMTRKSVLSMGAVAMVAALAACSDSPTAPASNARPVTPSFAAGDPVGTVVSNTPVLGQVIICKAGNVGGTFDLSARLTAGGTVPSSISVTNGQCKIAYVNNGASGVGAFVTVTEQAAANTVQTRTSCTIITQVDGAPAGTTTTGSCALAANSEYFTNSFHGYVVTFTNTFTAPPAGCTFTQGYYKNHESVVATLLGTNGGYVVNNKLVLSQDGTLALTAAQIDDNLESPPKGGDAFLILTHQLITAELNIKGGASVPPAVLTAINSARLLLNGGISSGEAAQAIALAAILDDYNNGISGPGHCD